MNPIVVIYGRLSRYDRMNGNLPFRGAAGAMFEHRTLDVARGLGVPVEVRVLGRDTNRPLPPNARLFCLGEECLPAMFGLDPNLNKHRGYCLNYLDPFSRRTHAAICTYHPIDCWDFKREEGEDGEDEADGGESQKDVAPTKRANYFPWARLDFSKLFRYADPLWKYAPAAGFIEAGHDHVSRWLTSLPPGTDLTLDIECRPQDFSLDVIGLRAGGQSYVPAIYNHDNSLAFATRAQLGRFYRALAQTFLRPDITIVGHNLAFDLAVLSTQLGLPLPTSMYDTMIAMHRFNPTIEKSLSHAISRFLITPRNHKADICPNVSAANHQRLRQYNAEDLLRTEQLKAAQLTEASNNPVLLTSIDSGNKLLHTTLMMSLTGIPTCQAATDDAYARLTFKAAQLERCCRILTGIPDFNPASPDQAADYLYRQLGYPSVEKDDDDQPAFGTGAKALYSLQILQDNPLIPLIIAYRETKKAASSLKFKPYKPLSL